MYVKLLFEIQRKYHINVLDYIVTSNHVHLLLSAPRANNIPKGDTWSESTCRYYVKKFFSGDVKLSDIFGPNPPENTKEGVKKYRKETSQRMKKYLSN